MVSGPLIIPNAEEGFGPPDVVLFDRACGSADDIQAIWDDDGAPPPCPPIGYGRFVPVEAECPWIACCLPTGDWLGPRCLRTTA